MYFFTETEASWLSEYLLEVEHSKPFITVSGTSWLPQLQIVLALFYFALLCFVLHLGGNFSGLSGKIYD